ncbi:MAG: hypothetical protein JNM09_19495 [Blastocatellia bacterium]|nr:hypothetical protein [Blastocatellia bacterium]
MNQFFYLSMIGLLGLVFIAAFTRQTNAQTDLKKLLAGQTSKQWELRDVKTDEKSFHEEEFNDNDEFELKSQLAQLIPETIVFNADGTCVLTYASQYKNGKVIEGDYKAIGKWSVDGKSVKILEEVNGDGKVEEKRDEIMWLKDVVATENSIKSKFALEGDYTGGVQELGYETEGASASASASSATDTYFEADGIAVNFPKGWKSENSQKQIAATSPDNTSKFFLMATGKDNFDNVHEKILTPWLHSSYTGVKEVAQDNFESNGLGLRKITFSAKRKSDNAAVTIIVQFAFKLGDEPPKTVLLINAAAGNTHASAVSEVFTKQKVAVN